jgi:hypothetical protein
MITTTVPAAIRAKNVFVGRDIDGGWGGRDVVEGRGASIGHRRHSHAVGAGSRARLICSRRIGRTSAAVRRTDVRLKGVHWALDGSFSVDALVSGWSLASCDGFRACDAGAGLGVGRTSLAVF